MKLSCSSPLSDFPSSFTTSIAEEDLKEEKGVSGCSNIALLMG